MKGSHIFWWSRMLKFDMYMMQLRLSRNANSAALKHNFIVRYKIGMHQRKRSVINVESIPVNHVGCCRSRLLLLSHLPSDHLVVLILPDPFCVHPCSPAAAFPGRDRSSMLSKGMSRSDNPPLVVSVYRVWLDPWDRVLLLESPRCITPNLQKSCRYFFENCLLNTI